MKTVSIFLGILLSLLLLVNFCYAGEENVAEFQPEKGTAGVTTKNGEEDQEEKFKFLHHPKPFFKKPFFKKPFFKPVPLKHPIVKKPIPIHPFLKKPIPVHPFLKKPFPKPYNPPVFSTHP